MSTIQPEDIFAAEVWYLRNYMWLAASVFWLIDYIATLPDEITTIWPRRMSYTSMIFLFNRYTFLSFLLLSLIMILPGAADDETCLVLGYTIVILLVAANTSTGVLSSIRIYGLYSKDRAIMAVLGLFILFRLIIETYGEIFLEVGVPTTGTPFTSSRCQPRFANSKSFAVVTQLAVPLLSFCFDGCIITLIVKKGYGHALNMRGLNQFTVVELMVRDGLLFFVIIALVSGALVVISIVSLVEGGRLSPKSSGFFNVLQPLFFAVPNLLMNRMLLSLRKWRPRSHCSNSPSRTTEPMELSELRFKRMAHRFRPRDASILDETDAGVADEEQNTDIAKSLDDSSHLSSLGILRKVSIEEAATIDAEEDV